MIEALRTFVDDNRANAVLAALPGPRCHDTVFYYIKNLLRDRFPGAMIEIAEGTITVCRGDIVAKVDV
ncbi:MAG: hypothetical protein JJ902_03985 [Roseibium sp.]|nr:hypothetical protein [Roseibium sp.]